MSLENKYITHIMKFSIEKSKTYKYNPQQNQNKSKTKKKQKNTNKETETYSRFAIISNWKYLSFSQKIRIRIRCKRRLYLKI